MLLESKQPLLQYGPPTLDRPFGLALWPLFETAFEPIMGYLPQDFRFVPGSNPISTVTATATTLISYYVVVFSGREFMKGREPLQLSMLFKIHNFGLTAISFVLLALFLEQLVPEIARNGIFHAICHRDGGWTNRLVILYYLNYLTKYLELVDTVFLFLKKKPLTFLHTYHHGATALLCFTQLIGNTSVSWVPITLNLTVHVLMYWYYFQAARGVRIWWKQYITILQIIQFVIDLGFVYFASYTYFTSTYFPWMPNAGRCAGEEFAAFAGMGILTSYLVLFLGFYAATYKKPPPKGKGKQRGRATSALVEMKDEKVPTVAETRRRFSASGQQNVTTGGKSLKSNGNANGSASGRAAQTPASTRTTRSRKA